MGKAPVIVEATGSASGGKPGLSGRAIEEAMAQATRVCMEEGITDPDVIRDRKLAAREKVKQDFRDAAAKSSADDE